MLPVGEQVGDRSAAGEAAWHRKEVTGPEPFGQLRGDAGDDVGVGQSGQRVELHMPAGVGDRLKYHRLHSGLRHAVADDRAELVLVEAAFHRGHQADGQARRGQLSRARCFTSRRSWPRIRRCVASSRPSNCR